MVQTPIVTQILVKVALAQQFLVQKIQIAVFQIFVMFQSLNVTNVKNQLIVLMAIPALMVFVHRFVELKQ